MLITSFYVLALAKYTSFASSALWIWYLLGTHSIFLGSISLKWYYYINNHKQSEYLVFYVGFSFFVSLSWHVEVDSYIVILCTSVWLVPIPSLRGFDFVFLTYLPVNICRCLVMSMDIFISCMFWTSWDDMREREWVSWYILQNLYFTLVLSSLLCDSDKIWWRFFGLEQQKLGLLCQLASRWFSETDIFYLSTYVSYVHFSDILCKSLFS